MKPLHDVEAIIVHHTASPAESTTLEKVDRWHRDRGFDSIGYHYLIEWDGWVASVRHGRPDHMRGAHCLNGWNRKSLGVCVVGSWEDTPWDEMPDELRWVLVDLVVSLLRINELDVDCVLGHREAHPGHTVCPGFDPEDLRRAVRHHLEQG